MSTNHRHALGRWGEGLAAEHFERLGYRVVARNHRTSSGEIDLIVLRDATLVFAEVKTRRADGYDPFESITWSKRRRLRRLGAEWLADHAPRPYRLVRFDAVAVVIDRAGRLMALDHREDAL